MHAHRRTPSASAALAHLLLLLAVLVAGVALPAEPALAADTSNPYAAQGLPGDPMVVHGEQGGWDYIEMIAVGYAPSYGYVGLNWDVKPVLVCKHGDDEITASSYGPQYDRGRLPTDVPGWHEVRAGCTTATSSVSRTFRYFVYEQGGEGDPGDPGSDPVPEPEAPGVADLRVEEGPEVGADPGQEWTFTLTGTGDNGVVSGDFLVKRKGSGEVLLSDRMFIRDEGRRTVVMPGLPLGRHELVIDFVGTGRYKPTQVELVLDSRHGSSLNPAREIELWPGESMDLDVRVDSSVAVSGGTLRLRRDDALVASAPVSAGRATLTVPAMPRGTHPLTLDYDGTTQVRDAELRLDAVVGDWITLTPDSYVVQPGQLLEVPAPGVLANDEGADGDWHVEFLVPGHNGAGSLSPDGSLRYEANDPAFRGRDRVGYRVKDLDAGDGPRRSKITFVDVLVGAEWLADVDVRTQPYGAGWRDAGDPAAVVDGNPARAVVEVRNPTSVAARVDVRVEGPDGAAVGGTDVPLTLASGQTREVTVDVDTRGYAWTAAGDAAVDPQDFTVEVRPEGHGTARETVPVRVDPLPVVLAHGYNTTALSTWGPTADREGFDAMLRRHHPRLRGWAVGDGQHPGTMRTGDLFAPGITGSVRENAAEEARYVDAVREETGAHHVDVVAHSMGGLITRRYLHSLQPTTVDDEPVVRHLVQVGTPNLGSPCADDMLQIATEEGNPLLFPQPATFELSTGVNFRFGLEAPGTGRTELSNFVGTGIPLPCGEGGDSDLVVPVPSAQWTIPTAHLASGAVVHTSMTTDEEVVADYVVPRLADAPGTDGTGKRLHRSDTGDERAVAEASRRSTFATAVLDVPATGVATHAVEVPPGTRFGVTGMAADVTVELVDPQGEVRARGSAQDPAMPFLAAAVDAHEAGRWTVRATGAGRVLPLTFWLEGDAVRLRVDDVRVDTRGGGTVTARLEGATGRVRATVTDGTSVREPVTLEAAGDGEHRVRLRDLPVSGAVVVRATLADGTTRTTTAALLPTGDEPEPDPDPEPAPVVTRQPTSVTARFGTTARFTVATSGSVTSRQWQWRDGDTWRDLSGGTGATLLVPVTSPAQDGRAFRVVVSGPGGTTVSDVAKLTTERVPTTLRPLLVGAGRTLGAVALTVRPVATSPGGTVEVREGTRLLGRARVGAGGWVAVRLPGLARGRHELTVAYLGSDRAAPSSLVRTVRVR